jgi:pyruvate dehydrogenase E1 component beta subunit
MTQGFDDLDAPVERVGAPFAPPPFSPSLEAAFLVDAQDIAAAARRTVGTAPEVSS